MPDRTDRETTRGDGGAGPAGAAELVGRRHPVALALRVRLRDQVQALRAAGEPGREEDDATRVHEARVASRRLRVMLTTFGPAFRPEETERLREELRWLAGSLGEARDRHVACERLSELAEREGDAAGPLLVRLGSEEWSPGEGGAVEGLDAQRYQDLVMALDALVADPPWSPAAYQDAGPFVRRRVGKEWRRLRSKVDRLPEAAAEPARDHQLHEVRKAAKRLRYALEVAELLWRHKPTRLRREVHHLSDVLGARQDSAVTRGVLRRLSVDAHAAGEPTFVHGRLDHLEELRAVELEEEFGRAWPQTVRRRRGWP